MNLVEVLSEQEKKMINAYINEYVDRDHASLEYLLRYWNENKSDYLYKMFGNQLMLSKDIEWAKPKSKIQGEIYDLYNRNASVAAQFRKIFDRFLWTRRHDLGDAYYMLQSLLDIEYLASTAYTGEEFEVNTPDGKVIKVQKGARPMRILSRVAKAYGGIELLDEFQVAISQVLNQKKLTGRLTISIHPLDYMTMSDNNNGWSSCMSWSEGGCYCRGTVEMMNSPMVIVAYLASDDITMWLPGGYDWNSKKWRELFIVTKDFITGVKGYPYQNEELVKIVNLWLKDLAEKNLGWKYEKENTAYPHRKTFDHIDPETGEVHEAFVRFSTYTMYNDFGSLDEHYGIFAPGCYDIHHTYSGPEICMKCGDDECDFDGEGTLMCCSCYDPIYCSDCGDRIDGDDVYWLDGNAYCENCYYEVAYDDDLTGEPHHTESLTSVYLIEDDSDLTEDSFYDAPYIRVYNFDYFGAWKYNFTAPANRWRGNWRTYYYVTPSMIQEERVSKLFHN